MFKNFFKRKKEKTPEELGQLLYQIIQMLLLDEKLSVEFLSVKSLLSELDLIENDVVDHYQVEIIIAFMY